MSRPLQQIDPIFSRRLDPNRPMLRATGRSTEEQHATNGAWVDRDGVEPNRFRCVGRRGWRLSVRLGESVRSRLDRRDPRAHRARVNWIDTAAVYGLGRSERVVASALRRCRGRAAFVFTKASRVWRRERHDRRQPQGRLDPTRVRSEPRATRSTRSTCTRSMAGPDEDIEEGWATLADLKQEGLSATSACPTSRWSSSSVSGRSLLSNPCSPPIHCSRARSRTRPPILPSARDRCHRLLTDGLRIADGIYVGRARSATSGRRLAKQARASTSRSSEPISSWQRGSASIGERRGAPAGAVAVAWVLRQPGICGAIAGLPPPRPGRRGPRGGRYRVVIRPRSPKWRAASSSGRFLRDRSRHRLTCLARICRIIAAWRGILQTSRSRPASARRRSAAS